MDDFKITINAKDLRRAAFAVGFGLTVGKAVAPAPAKSIKYLYIPNPPSIPPTVTKITNILAGVSFVLSNKI